MPRLHSCAQRCAPGGSVACICDRRALRPAAAARTALAISWSLNLPRHQFANPWGSAASRSRRRHVDGRVYDRHAAPASEADIAGP